MELTLDARTPQPMGWKELDKLSLVTATVGRATAEVALTRRGRSWVAEILSPAVQAFVLCSKGAHTT